MGIVLGYVNLIGFLLLLIKFVTKRMGWKKADRLCKRIHKPVSCILMVSLVLHFVFILPVWKTRSVWVLLSGAITTGIGILVVVMCHVVKKERKMVWHRALSALLLVTTIIHMVTYFIDFNAYQDNIRSIEVEGIDLSEIEDGTYIGTYDAGYIYAKVEVTVKQHRMENIVILTHRTERGKKAEVVVNHMLQEQKMKVDAISGATNSSLVIEKACENALRERKK